MPDEKLTLEERREMILAFLRGESATKLAKQYGVSRSWVYAAAAAAKSEARTEYEFWGEVLREMEKVQTPGKEKP